MRHRIRAAGILLAGERMLLALEEVTDRGTEVWIPPGGGLESSDRSAVEALEREFREETGLQVRVGDLVYVREFRDPARAVHHLELFFLIQARGGELHGIERDRASFGSSLRRHVRWFTREELRSVTVAPEVLRDDIWQRRDGRAGALYLGRSAPLP